MGCDKRVVVAGKEKQVAVLNIDVSLLDVDSKGNVDIWEVSDADFVLQIECP